MAENESDQLPNCLGDPCKTVEYLIWNLTFKGVILNADAPRDQWVTTIPEALPPALRRSWEDLLQRTVPERYSARARAQSFGCGEDCRCSPEEIKETALEKMVHRQVIREPGTGQLLAIGYATYELQVKTTTGRCVPNGETEFRYIKQPSETFVGLLGSDPPTPRRPGRKGTRGKGARA